MFHPTDFFTFPPEGASMSGSHPRWALRMHLRSESIGEDGRAVDCWPREHSQCASIAHQLFHYSRYAQLSQQRMRPFIDVSCWLLA